MKNLVLLALAFLPLAACGAPQFAVTPEYGLTKFEGDFAISNGTVGATTSLESIGLDDREGTFGARADLKWGSPHLSVSASKLSTSGSGRTTVTLSQGTTTIPLGTDVDSDLDLTQANAIVTFDLVPTDTVEFGLGLGVEAAKLKTEIAATGLGASIDTDESVPIPVVAARFGLDLGPFVFDALLAGIKIDYSGDELTFYDLDARATWQATDHVHLLLGYKRWDVDLEYEDSGDNAVLDTVASGPYVGLTIAF